MRACAPAVVAACGILFVGFVGGCMSSSSGSVISNRTVNVWADGGFADVPFEVSNGERVRITLMADKYTMIPYGEIQNPNRVFSYFPPPATCHDGINTGDVTLQVTGTYTLTVYDGSRVGGNITVRIERLQ